MQMGGAPGNGPGSFVAHGSKTGIPGIWGGATKGIGAGGGGGGTAAAGVGIFIPPRQMGAAPGNGPGSLVAHGSHLGIGGGGGAATGGGGGGAAG